MEARGILCEEEAGLTGATGVDGLTEEEGFSSSGMCEGAMCPRSVMDGMGVEW
jgi:hypothetical protein